MSFTEHIICDVSVKLFRGITVARLQASFKGSPCGFNTLSVYSAVVGVNEVGLVVHPLVIILRLQGLDASVRTPSIRNNESPCKKRV